MLAFSFYVLIFVYTQPIKEIMARLVNNKGAWLIQIPKQNPWETYLLFGNLGGDFITVEYQDIDFVYYKVYSRIFEWNEPLSITEYRELLTKISTKPDSEVIISKIPTREDHKFVRHHLLDNDPAILELKWDNSVIDGLNNPNKTWIDRLIYYTK